MDFRDRAVEKCRKDFDIGVVQETHVRAVLGCVGPDVSCMTVFLHSEMPEIRMAASRIIASKGRAEDVVVALMSEENITNVFEMLKVVGQRGEGVEMLEGMLDTDDMLVRDSVMDMFRKAGKASSLFPLVFDKDDKVVRRVKRYIDESRKN